MCYTYCAIDSRDCKIRWNDCLKDSMNISTIFNQTYFQLSHACRKSFVLYKYIKSSKDKLTRYNMHELFSEERNLFEYIPRLRFLKNINFKISKRHCSGDSNHLENISTEPNIS
mgnify:CR=1 FL=1